MPAKNRGGRPTLLTPELIQLAEELAPRALYVDSLSALLGVHRHSVMGWLKTGRQEALRRAKGKKPNAKLDLHVRFFDTLKKAFARVEGDHIALISEAAKLGTWQCAAWLLERRWPKKWSLRHRTELDELQRRFTEIEKIIKKAEERKDEENATF